MTNITTSVFGSEEMLKSSPVDKIPQHPTAAEIAYRIVKDETFAQTQPRLNLATFVTTYMDPYATKLINDAIAMTGRRKGWTNEEGEFNWDKISSALSQSIGIMGPVYDGIMSAFEQRGQGGGINFSVLPVPSAAIRATSNVTSALTRESTEGARAQALAGAMIQNVGDLTGLSRHAFTQAAWIWLIGDRAKKWSMGEQAWRQHIRRLQREGFQNLPSLEFTN